jgi:hypothetical protein
VVRVGASGSILSATVFETAAESAIWPLFVRDPRGRIEVRHTLRPRRALGTAVLDSGSQRDFRLHAKAEATATLRSGSRNKEKAVTPLGSKRGAQVSESSWRVHH